MTRFLVITVSLLLCSDPIASYAQQPDIPAQLPTANALAADYDAELTNAEAEAITAQAASIEDDHYGDISWRGSIMFKRRDLDRIYSLLDGIEIPTEMIGDFIPRDQPGMAESEEQNVADLVQDVTLYAPAFYLQSILYYQPDNWTIWLNEKRNSTSSKRQDALEIELVESDRVIMRYAEPNLNNVAPNWMDTFLNFSTNQSTATVPTASNEFVWDYVSPDGNILVDESQGVIRFALEPTQSFIVHEVAIIEGKGEGLYITFRPGQGRIAANEESVNERAVNSASSEAANVTPSEPMDRLTEPLTASQELMNELLEDLN